VPPTHTPSDSVSRRARSRWGKLPQLRALLEKQPCLSGLGLELRLPCLPCLDLGQACQDRALDGLECPLALDGPACQDQALDGLECPLAQDPVCLPMDLVRGCQVEGMEETAPLAS